MMKAYLSSPPDESFSILHAMFHTRIAIDFLLFRNQPLVLHHLIGNTSLHGGSVRLLFNVLSLHIFFAGTVRIDFLAKVIRTITRRTSCITCQNRKRSNIYSRFFDEAFIRLQSHIIQLFHNCPELLVPL